MMEPTNLKDCTTLETNLSLLQSWWMSFPFDRKTRLQRSVISGRVQSGWRLMSCWLWFDSDCYSYIYTAINDNNRIKSTHKAPSFLSGIDPLQQYPIVKEGVNKHYRKNVNAIDCRHYIYWLHDFFDLATNCL